MGAVRRGLGGHGVRWHAPRLPAGDPVAGRAGGQDRVGRQDLLYDRMEGRLGGRRAAAGRRGCRTAPVPDLHHRHPAAMGRGRGAGPAAGMARRAPRALRFCQGAAGGGAHVRRVCRPGKENL